MKCPDCGATWLRPSRHVEDDPPRREYKCGHCGARFTTVETMQAVHQRDQLLLDLFHSRQEFRRDVSQIINGSNGRNGNTIQQEASAQ